MSNEIYYKGFVGTVNFCNEDRLLYGKVINVPDTVSISYHGYSIDEVIEGFEYMIDSHLEDMENDEALLGAQSFGNVQIPA